MVSPSPEIGAQERWHSALTLHQHRIVSTTDVDIIDVNHHAAVFSDRGTDGEVGMNTCCMRIAGATRRVNATAAARQSLLRPEGVQVERIFLFAIVPRVTGRDDV